MRVITAVAALACLPIAVLAQSPSGGGWRANPALVTRLSAQRPDTIYDEAKVPAYTLPELLTTPRGVVTTPAQWTARRAEIVDLLRDTVYGRSPGRPEHVDFAVVEENPRAMDGAATLRRVAITSRHGQKSHRFELTLFVPNAVGRAPVFLFINNRPASLADPTRKEKSGFWPAEQIVGRGYAAAVFQYGDLAPDDKAAFRTGVMTMYDGAATAGRPAYTWGAVAAWAWGASRAMDYLATDARVDATHVAIVGHSRGGKAALWAGAEDERFALVVSNESGEGGAALSRRMFGETVERINTAFPHWFSATYKTFDARVPELPTDQHMLLASIAPRPLYVASADQDLWADPRGEFLSLVATSPVYGLWGEPAIAAESMPAIDTPLIVGRRAYHVRTGEHDLTPFDWDRYADFADRLWKQK